MLAHNTKRITEGRPVVDFDPVSLYPFVMARLYCLEGMPKVVDAWTTKYLLSHLFENGQTEPTAERFISGFFVVDKIVKVGIERAFPLILRNPDANQGEELERATNYIAENNNMINEAETLNGSNVTRVVKLKPINRHYTFVTLRVNIFSMSKRIMNEVMCTAEDIGVDIMYQDTDSMHLYKDQLDALSEEFRVRYGGELVGSRMGQ